MNKRPTSTAGFPLKAINRQLSTDISANDYTHIGRNCLMSCWINFGGGIRRVSVAMRAVAQLMQQLIFSYFCCYAVVMLLCLCVWPSVLWRCWLGGRKGIRPVKKTEWWGAGVVICLEQGTYLHMVQLMPLPLTVSCFSKIQIGFTFLVPAHPGSPGQRAVKRVCVCCYAVSF